MKEYLEASASDLVIGFRIRIHRRQEIHSGSPTTKLHEDGKSPNKRDSSKTSKAYESVTEETHDNAVIRRRRWRSRIGGGRRHSSPETESHREERRIL